jgi:ketopantoate reductase
LASNEERCSKLEEKMKFLKDYKNMVKSCIQIQCKVIFILNQQCAKLFNPELYKGHFKTCMTEIPSTAQSEEKKFKISVLKEIQNKDEKTGKIHFEFVIEVENKQNTWKINRKLTHFSSLNKQVN